MKSSFEIGVHTVSRSKSLTHNLITRIVSLIRVADTSTRINLNSGKCSLLLSSKINHSLHCKPSTYTYF